MGHDYSKYAEHHDSRGCDDEDHDRSKPKLWFISFCCRGGGGMSPPSLFTSAGRFFGAREGGGMAERSSCFTGTAALFWSLFACKSQSGSSSSDDASSESPSIMKTANDSPNTAVCRSTHGVTTTG